jgi:hypothetical protein
MGDVQHEARRLGFGRRPFYCPTRRRRQLAKHEMDLGLLLWGLERGQARSLWAPENRCPADTPGTSRT